MGRIVGGILCVGLVAGAIIFLATIYNLMTIPHPIWFVVSVTFFPL